MEDFPLCGGRISPGVAEGFPLLSWKDFGGRGRISPRIVEEFPSIGGRISPQVFTAARRDAIAVGRWMECKDPLAVT
jgi:hypothetical protein